MRIRLSAGLLAAALACVAGCGEGKKEMAADPGPAPQTLPQAGGDDPAKAGRRAPPEVPPGGGGPLPPAPFSDSRGGPERPQPKPPAPKPKADRGEQLLKELDKLPVGIKVVHTPAKLKASRNDGTKANIDQKWTYEWSYKTTVSAMDKDTPLTIVGFGSCEWVDEKWAIPANRDEYDVIEGGTGEFAEWYTCPMGKLEPGKEYTDPQNWSGSKKLRAFKQKWFYVGEDKDGKRYKGEAEVELLGELDAPEKGKEPDKARKKPDGD